MSTGAIVENQEVTPFAAVLSLNCTVYDLSIEWATGGMYFSRNGRFAPVRRTATGSLAPGAPSAMGDSPHDRVGNACWTSASPLRRTGTLGDRYCGDVASIQDMPHRPRL